MLNPQTHAHTSLLNLSKHMAWLTVLFVCLVTWSKSQNRDKFQVWANITGGEIICNLNQVNKPEIQSKRLLKNESPKGICTSAEEGCEPLKGWNGGSS